MRDTKFLAPIVRHKWNLVVTDCAKMGIEVMVIETKRDFKTQVAYHAQGRKELDVVNRLRKEVGLWAITEKQNKIITHTMESIHFYDCALDFALVIDGKPSWDTKADINDDDIFDYGNVGHIAKLHGFTWGGDFSFKDYAHLQYTGGLSIQDLKDGKRPQEDVLKYI